MEEVLQHPRVAVQRSRVVQDFLHSLSTESHLSCFQKLLSVKRNPRPSGLLVLSSEYGNIIPRSSIYKISPYSLLGTSKPRRGRGPQSEL